MSDALRPVASGPTGLGRSGLVAQRGGGGLGGARYTPLWWASLTFGGATYLLLALGLRWSVPWQLRELDAYSSAQLDRRESQLDASLARARRMLRGAEDLARAVTPQKAATILCAGVVAMVGLQGAAMVVPRSGGRLRALGTASYDARLQQWSRRRRARRAPCGTGGADRSLHIIRDGQ